LNLKFGKIKLSILEGSSCRCRFGFNQTE